jgi:hypothetical protein
MTVDPTPMTRTVWSVVIALPLPRGRSEPGLLDLRSDLDHTLLAMRTTLRATVPPLAFRTSAQLGLHADLVVEAGVIPIPDEIARSAPAAFHSSACWRDWSASSIDDRYEVSLAPRATTATLELGSHLDRKRHMVDVAVNVRRSLQSDRLSADHARDLAAHDDLSTRDHSRDLPFLTDDHLGRLHVAFNLAVNLQNAATDDLQPLADDLEVIPNHRFLAI